MISEERQEYIKNTYNIIGIHSSDIATSFLLINWGAVPGDLTKILKMSL